MPVLTRAAARRLQADGEGDSTLASSTVFALRDAVTHKAEAVWASRAHVDAYTDAARAATSTPEVDHILEVQFAETALVRAFRAEPRARADSLATAVCAAELRDALNAVGNLNVTSRRVNQNKKGPFTAALRRLDDDRLRTVSLEQLARQGRAKSLVDDGTWARIERTVVVAYDGLEDRAHDDGGGWCALPAANTLATAAVHELGAMLAALGVE